MSDISATAHNPFDEARPYLLSLYMTLVGYSVLVALPAINSAWVDQLGFTDVEAVSYTHLTLPTIYSV